MLKFKYDGKEYEIKYYQVQRQDGSNKIIQRSVNKVDKGYGQILEFWSSNSNRINITGTLVDESFAGTGVNPIIAVGLKANTDIGNSPVGGSFDFKEFKYPEEEVKDFIDLCQYQGRIRVVNEQINSTGVEWVTVSNFALPFTEGEVYQDFSLTLVSDSLLEEQLEVELRNVES